MPINSETLNKNLYDALRSRGYDPISLNSKGNPSNEVEKADVFRFSVKNNEGKLVPAWATIEGPELVLYTDDNFSDVVDFDSFVRYMKNWAQRKLLGFNITNKDHLRYDMQKRTNAKQKENLGEGYYPINKKTSYNDNIPQVKIVINHTRQLDENEQRFRYVDKIFLENTNGERFLLPTKRPGIARVYARHVAEGGVPNDDKWNHIKGLVEEYTKMAGFVRATRRGQFNEQAVKLVNEGLKHYNSLKMTLQGLTSQRGYNKYFESYTPVLNEETEENYSINELFIQEKLDPRIESVMPILNRLSKNIVEMAEVNELKDWSKSLIGDIPEEKISEASLGKFDDVKYHDYEVIKNGRAIGTWNGEKFTPFDRTIYKFRDSDSIPAGSKVNYAGGPVTDRQLGLRKIGLEETMNGIKNLFDTEADIHERIDAASQIKNESDFLKAIVDPSPIVRLYAIQNPNLPTSCLLMAIHDPNKQVKDAAMKKFNKLKTKKMFSLKENSKSERPYVCVHSKKGKYECNANSSYEAAQKAAKNWKLKSTAGIDVHLADVKHSTQHIGEQKNKVVDDKQCATEVANRLSKKKGLTSTDIIDEIENYKTQKLFFGSKCNFDTLEVLQLVKDKLKDLGIVNSHNNITESIHGVRDSNTGENILIFDDNKLIGMVERTVENRIVGHDPGYDGVGAWVFMHPKYKKSPAQQSFYKELNDNYRKSITDPNLRKNLSRVDMYVHPYYPMGVEDEQDSARLERLLDLHRETFLGNFSTMAEATNVIIKWYNLRDKKQDHLYVSEDISKTPKKNIANSYDNITESISAKLDSYTGQIVIFDNNKLIGMLEEWGEEGRISDNLGAWVFQHPKYKRSPAQQSFYKELNDNWKKSQIADGHLQPPPLSRIDIHTHPYEEEDQKLYELHIETFLGNFSTRAEATKAIVKWYNLRDKKQDHLYVSEDISKSQKRVGQLGPTEPARHISPVLGKKPKQHPFKGKLVGGS